MVRWSMMILFLSFFFLSAVFFFLMRLMSSISRFKIVLSTSDERIFTGLDPFQKLDWTPVERHYWTRHDRMTTLNDQGPSVFYHLLILDPGSLTRSIHNHHYLNYHTTPIFIVITLQNEHHSSSFLNWNQCHDRSIRNKCRHVSR
jgi:hypothetical protein